MKLSGFSGQFRYTYWDPLLIISQIVTIQALFYSSLCILIFLGSVFHNQSPSLSHVFAYQTINVKTGLGLSVIFCYLVNTVCGAVYLWFFVQRAKPCLDYSITVYILHLLFSYFYNGLLPHTYSWWILIVLSTGAMCICGEFLCMRTEMKAIPLLSQKSDV